MKILMAPSESKQHIGKRYTNRQNLLFDDLTNERDKVIKAYRQFIGLSSINELSKIFGLKKEQDILLYKDIILNKNNFLLKAIQRYDGVAFKYLNYDTLNDQERGFLDKNLIIFSNLYGPILAGDLICDYRLKQGEKIGSLCVDKFYKTHFSLLLDNLLEDEFIIDLRAKYYIKFYKPKVSYITLNFIKNGKVVSHWAKAYRGLVARKLVKYRPMNENEFQQIDFKNLNIVEIREKKLTKDYIFEII